MFIIPLFDPDIYTDQANSFDYTLTNLNNLLLMTPTDAPLSQIAQLMNFAVSDHQD